MVLTNTHLRVAREIEDGAAPSDKDLGLLVAAMADAAISRDETAARSPRRRRAALSLWDLVAANPQSPELRGRIWMLDRLAGMVALMLDPGDEEDVAVRGWRVGTSHRGRQGFPSPWIRGGRRHRLC